MVIAIKVHAAAGSLSHKLTRPRARFLSRLQRGESPVVPGSFSFGGTASSREQGLQTSKAFRRQALRQSTYKRTVMLLLFFIVILLYQLEFRRSQRLRLALNLIGVLLLEASPITRGLPAQQSTTYLLALLEPEHGLRQGMFTRCKSGV